MHFIRGLLVVLPFALIFYSFVPAVASEATNYVGSYIAAGVLPYANWNDKVYLLLGHEPSRRYWTDFVGKREPTDCNAIDTAAREFAEETRRAYPVSKTILKLRYTTPIEIEGGRIKIWLLKVDLIDANEITNLPNVKDSEKDTYCWMQLSGLLDSTDNGGEFSTFPTVTCTGQVRPFYNKFRNNLVRDEELRIRLDALIN